MRKPVFRSLFPVLLACLLASSGFANVPHEDSSDNLTPTSSQVLVDQTVNGLLSRYHYGKKKLDNNLSRFIFKHYLRALDPSKTYFTQANIDHLDKYAKSMGDTIQKGNLEPAFEIYNVYRNSVDRQVHYALNLLDKKIDLKTDESYTFDRSKAAWPANQAALDALWEKRVANDVINLMLAGKTRDEAADALKKRYKRYLEQASQVDSVEVFNTFMNTYAHAMDPHTAYFSPQQSEQFRIEMSLRLQGIGAALRRKDQYITIDRILPGGPAAQSDKLSTGDRIVGVGQGKKGDMVDTVGWRLSDVVELIRGKKGTTVRLKLLPRGAPPGSRARQIALVRDVIELKSQAASAKTIDVDRHGKTRKVGVIEIPSFYRDFKAQQAGKDSYRSTTRDVRKLIDKLKKKDVDALVVDLRNNPGGSLAEATSMVGLFVGKGPVVQIRDTDGKVKVRRDSKAKVAWRGPLVVMVNRFSASASEIFAAAIQDYQRGAIVGSTTYGKGTVQSLVNLNHFVADKDAGKLKLTIAKFYRITGSSTQDHGVEPDITLPSPIDTSQFGESTSENALPWDHISSADFDSAVSGGLDEALPKLRQRHMKRINNNPTFELFLKDVNHARKMHERTKVSLNIEKRRAARSARDARSLDEINAWRKISGKKPVKSLEAVPSDYKRPDVLLHEAAKIAVDMNRLDLDLRKPGTRIAAGKEKAAAGS